MGCSPVLVGWVEPMAKHNAFKTSGQQKSVAWIGACRTPNHSLVFYCFDRCGVGINRFVARTFQMRWVSEKTIAFAIRSVDLNPTYKNLLRFAPFL